MLNKMAKSVLILVFVYGFIGCQKSEQVQMQQTPQKVLRHVVLFGFAPDATPADVKRVEDAFRALPSKIDVIKDFEWGTNVSPENLANGYTHCFFLTFASEADRDAYLPHPAHKAFGDIIGSSLSQVLVVDYWTQE